MVSRRFAIKPANAKLVKEVHDFVLKDFPGLKGIGKALPSSQLWKGLRDFGSKLWLDTGNKEEAWPLWTSEFSGLTTNNTLLNREVQKGVHDRLIVEADRMLASHNLDDRRRMLEIAFILNAKHCLGLVSEFDAYVSLEEHTDMANDVNMAVEYGRRFFQVCPERFIVKIPLTPAGIIATRRLSSDHIPVNHTLGFSARQNYLVTRISRPAYVNLFLDRLNSLISENKLGNGKNIGEKAAIASQKAIRDLRRTSGVETLQVAASIRGGRQIASLAGVDVLTIPPKAAKDLVDTKPAPALRDRTGDDFTLGLASPATAKTMGVDSLWNISDKLVSCLDALESVDVSGLAPTALVSFFAEHGCADVLPAWDGSQMEQCARDGKITVIDHWKNEIAEGKASLDSLMNLAGLCSFVEDQAAMDRRVHDVLSRA